jgi:hypothetical protein
MLKSKADYTHLLENVSTQATLLIIAVANVLLIKLMQMGQIELELGNMLVNVMSMIVLLSIGAYLAGIALGANISKVSFVIVILVTGFALSRFLLNQPMMPQELQKIKDDVVDAVNDDRNLSEVTDGVLPEASGFNPQGTDMQSNDINPDMENCLAINPSGDLTAPCDAYRRLGDELSAQGVDGDIKGFSGGITGASLDRNN